MVNIAYKKCISSLNKNERVIGVFEIPDDALITPPLENTFAKYKVNKCKLIRVEELNGKIVDMDSVSPIIFFTSEPSIVYNINVLIELDYKQEGILMFFERIRAELYLVDRVKKGFIIKWRDNGIKYSEETFENSLRNGICKYYYPNGNIKETATYFNEYIKEKQYLYNEEGNLIKINDYTPLYKIDNYNGKYT